MEIETSEGAREITEDNVMYWSTHFKELQGKFKDKSLKLLKHDCIQYIGYDEEFKSKYTFICLPLNTSPDWDMTVNGEMKTFQKKPFTANYNSTTYKIYKNSCGRFCCNCQGWNTKEKKGEGNAEGCQCAHTLALFLAFKCKKFQQED